MQEREIDKEWEISSSEVRALFREVEIAYQGTDKELQKSALERWAKALAEIKIKFGDDKENILWQEQSGRFMQLSEQQRSREAAYQTPPRGFNSVEELLRQLTADVLEKIGESPEEASSDPKQTKQKGMKTKDGKWIN